ncbi:hypothetical protein A0J61_10821 [Choanephora cucurbitarum]|uniref:Uncharacterized protein n=1 Tax=Choanephora cucurbitarum TaxID=101091 RepID=A0A1C7MWC5_9FUNG|nr:hypothetical protein A0J61_10821 [Choanephora cucurbitarum]
MITMDGNFQTKRLDDKFQEELPVDGMFSLSVGEKSLWGTKVEVVAAAYTTPGPSADDEDEDCFAESVEVNSFKANNNNKRNGSSRRYDENGVLSMSCARHDVPERLLNIHGGEGHKYAVACVGHMLRANPQKKKYAIMYDIGCLVRKGLESSFSLHNSNNINNLQRRFPVFKEDTWYGVTAYHAYAHTMTCHVNYNPKYIPNFGCTDGEGCERFWSYLDGFVSMTRSTSSENRLLVITDSVDNFTYQNKLELPEQIKYKRKYNKKI